MVKQNYIYNTLLVCNITWNKTVTSFAIFKWKQHILITDSTELNDLRITICFRKSEVIVERILVDNVIENWWDMTYTVCHAPMQKTS